MKKFNSFQAIIAIALFSVSLISCDDNDKPGTEPEPEDSVSGYYILNNGKWANNNASLSFYNPETDKVETDRFKAVNNRGLGDLAQDIIVYGDKMYIAVYGSGTIEVTDKKGKSVEQIKSTDSENPLQPRYLTSHNGKIYVSLFDGYVARIDTLSLEIEKTIKVGRNPEQLVVTNNKLYVANSGGISFPDYDNTVSVIDIPSFTEQKKIEMIVNPCDLAVNSKGDVYVISLGEYGNPDLPNTLQRINANTDKVEVIENATRMTILDDEIYAIYNQWGAETIGFYIYDTIKKEVTSERFISENSTIPNPYRISIDGSPGAIFISDSDYTNNGDVYMFSLDGTLQKKFEAGLNPEKVIKIEY